MSTIACEIATGEVYKRGFIVPLHWSFWRVFSFLKKVDKIDAIKLLKYASTLAVKSSV